MDEILCVENLTKYFTKKSIFDAKTITVKAADKVSFSIRRGQVFVLAGESGSGKSTIAKMILKSIIPDSGKIIFEGNEITNDNQSIMRLKMGCQMIHQDPYDSINPRMKVGSIVLEPLEIHNIGDKNTRRERMLEVLQEVKLEPVNEIVEKYPHMLSGGQRQRIVLARALTTRPKIILADEPVSMLDVSIRAEMLELMNELREKYKISFIYITHDLATAKHFGQKIGILYMGKIVEMGEINKVLSKPRHPYTQALIDAISEPDPSNLLKKKEIKITESVTKIGCRFSDRCPYVMEKCSVEPNLEEKDTEHFVACYLD